MQSRDDRRKLLKLYDKYFKENANISVEDDINFNIKLIEKISEKYKTINKGNENNGIKNYIIREKLSLKATIDSLESLQTDWKYTPILITTIISTVTLCASLLIQTTNNYISKIIDSGIKQISSSTNATDLNNFYKTIVNISSQNDDLIIRFIIYILIAIAIMIILYETLSKITKKRETRAIIFYKLCYDVICNVEEGKI